MKVVWLFMNTISAVCVLSHSERQPAFSYFFCIKFVVNFIIRNIAGCITYCMLFVSVLGNNWQVSVGSLLRYIVSDGVLQK